MSVEWGHVSFDGPYPLARWEPAYCAAVYVIMMRPDPRNRPNAYTVLYFGESGSLSEKSFYRSHHKYDCWIRGAGSEGNLYIGIHRMPNSTAQDRRQVESELVEQYRPVCNE